MPGRVFTPEELREMALRAAAHRIALLAEAIATDTLPSPLGVAVQALREQTDNLAALTTAA